MTTKKPKPVFIVEDNELYAMLLDYILSKDSVYRFVSFRSGEECIQNLYLKPDVIILDYGLPGMNGYETLQEIKRTNPNTHVVMLSNNTDQAVAEKLIAAGADDFVLKQGHGETQIIDIIELLLYKDELKKIQPSTFHLPTIFNFKRVFYFMVILTILSLGFFYLTD